MVLTKAELLNNLAACNNSQGNYAKGRELYQEVRCTF